MSSSFCNILFWFSFVLYFDLFRIVLVSFLFFHYFFVLFSRSVSQFFPLFPHICDYIQLMLILIFFWAPAYSCSRWAQLLSLLSVIFFLLPHFPLFIKRPVRTQPTYMLGLTAVTADSMSEIFVRLGALGCGTKTFFGCLANALAITFIFRGNQSNSAKYLI